MDAGESRSTEHPKAEPLRIAPPTTSSDTPYSPLSPPPRPCPCDPFAFARWLALQRECSVTTTDSLPSDLTCKRATFFSALPLPHQLQQVVGPGGEKLILYYRRGGAGSGPGFTPTQLITGAETRIQCKSKVRDHERMIRWCLFRRIPLLILSPYLKGRSVQLPSSPAPPWPHPPIFLVCGPTSTLTSIAALSAPCIALCTLQICFYSHSAECSLISF